MATADAREKKPIVFAGETSLIPATRVLRRPVNVWESA
jgi:hypothetical protein